MKHGKMRRGFALLMAMVCMLALGAVAEGTEEVPAEGAEETVLVAEEGEGFAEVDDTVPQVEDDTLLVEGDEDDVEPEGDEETALLYGPIVEGDGVYVGYALYTEFENLSEFTNPDDVTDLARVIRVYHGKGSHLLLVPEGEVAADYYGLAVQYKLADADVGDGSIGTEPANPVLTPEMLRVVGNVFSATKVMRSGKMLNCVYAQEGQEDIRGSYDLTDNTIYAIGEDDDGSIDDLREDQQYEVLYNTETFEVIKIIEVNG